jgi:hypothetical protein
MFGTHVCSVVPEPTADHSAEGTDQEILVQEVEMEVEMEPEQREPERLMASAKQSCKKLRTQL